MLNAFVIRDRRAFPFVGSLKQLFVRLDIRILRGVPILNEIPHISFKIYTYKRMY